MTQIFGWTEIGQPKPAEYVRYIAADENSDGEITMTVRRRDAMHAEITLPTDAAVEMALAILLTVRRRDAREAGLPEPTSIA